MAYLDTSRSSAMSNCRTAMANFATALFRAIIRWNDARITRNALSQLSLRELNDIGLVPGDIERIARR
ncbi:MAG: DUF1127 domain-containing protein [Rhodobacteraceae bacterium]|jgi:uncharacterized protein YjiS (DUF1127 family)|nr:DUF1127 domain-containing protein [Paracoccaceae bacterium]